MRKSPARNKFVMLLLAAWLSSAATYGQKPAEKREVQDVTATPANSSAAPYYALLIGNNEYRYVSKLRTAVGDADAVAQLLGDRFGFQTRVLHNATRSEIITALVKYRDSLPENSNLLIYYAGHGHKDVDADEAYWLPVDAQKDSNENWISAADITSDVRAIHSLHVLIISDSCYSGVLAHPREDPTIGLSERLRLVEKMFRLKSRTLMSSGSDEPVDDAGPNGHSVFANAVLLGLSQMADDKFTAWALFDTVQVRVGGGSPQLPQYNIIRNSGHNSGDFVFSRGGKGMVFGPVQGSGIACMNELAAQGGLGPKIRQGDIVPCKLLDQPLYWTAYDLPKLAGSAAQTKWKAMLTVIVDEEGKVIDIKPRGGTSLQGMDSAIKAAAQGWQTNQPMYRGNHVKSTFGLDIDFSQ